MMADTPPSTETIAPTPQSIDMLPEFSTCSKEQLFGSGRELPIFEIARLSYRQYHHVPQPYRRQEVVQVIGRSMHQGFLSGNNGYNIFFARVSRTTLDGKTIAENGTGDAVSTTELDGYEVLRPHEELYRWYNERKLWER